MVDKTTTGGKSVNQLDLWFGGIFFIGEMAEFTLIFYCAICEIQDCSVAEQNLVKEKIFFSFFFCRAAILLLKTIFIILYTQQLKKTLKDNVQKKQTIIILLNKIFIFIFLAVLLAVKITSTYAYKPNRRFVLPGKVLDYGCVITYSFPIFFLNVIILALDTFGLCMIGLSTLYQTVMDFFLKKN